MEEEKQTNNQTKENVTELQKPNMESKVCNNNEM